MKDGQLNPADVAELRPSGPAAAAILAAGIGCCAMGVMAVLGDALPYLANLLIFYQPTGSLSGVSTVAILLWLVSWLILGRLWRRKTLAMRRVNVAAFALLAFGILLTFPGFLIF